MASSWFELLEVVFEAVERVIGQRLNEHADLVSVDVAHFDPDHGMSAGQVAMRWWVNTVVPILLDRVTRRRVRGEFEARGWVEDRQSAPVSGGDGGPRGSRSRTAGPGSPLFRTTRTCREALDVQPAVAAGGRARAVDPRPHIFGADIRNWAPFRSTLHTPTPVTHQHESPRSAPSGAL